jgi:hypothetical protein
MNTINFIQDRDVFMSLWTRANACVERLAATPTTELLHFDSSNINTLIFQRLIRKLANFNGTGEFALIVLDPDPFNYFHFHFGKYPGFIAGTYNNEDDMADILMMDPGDSPADALGVRPDKYVVMPTAGEWFIYADRGWDWGTGVLSGPPDLMSFARASFAFYENANEHPREL